MEPRSRILGRLRGGIAREYLSTNRTVIRDHQLFADYPASVRDLADMFATRFMAVNGEYCFSETNADAAVALGRLLDGFSTDEMIVQADPFVADILQMAEPTKACVVEPTGDPLQVDSFRFSQARVAVSTCRFLVARTGSIVMAVPQNHGRRIYCLPEFHIVVARTDQLVASLDDVFSAFSEMQSLPSFMTIITGSSRTSDIEKKLVLGAHGPKRLAVVLIGSCNS